MRSSEMSRFVRRACLLHEGVTNRERKACSDLQVAQAASPRSRSSARVRPELGRVRPGLTCDDVSCVPPNMARNGSTLGGLGRIQPDLGPSLPNETKNLGARMIMSVECKVPFSHTRGGQVKPDVGFAWGPELEERPHTLTQMYSSGTVNSATTQDCFARWEQQAGHVLRRG